MPRNRWRPQVPVPQSFTIAISELRKRFRATVCFLMPKDIVAMLRGGDRRSIGRSTEVVRAVGANPQLFAGLIAALCSDDPLIRMRAADAAEKVTRTHPALARRFKKELLGLLNEATEPELRWHLAAIIPRIPLTPREIEMAAAVLREYLGNRSSIVKTFALQALFDLSQQDSRLRPEVDELVRMAARKGTPAMRARGRQLLRKLNGMK